MNAPDITLLFQVVHFFIAYCLLRKLVFSPALQILCKQEEDMIYLKHSIEKTQLKKEQDQMLKRKRWGKIKQSLYGLMPSLMMKYFDIDKDTSQLKTLQDDRYSLSEQHRNSIKKIISEKVSKVDL